MLELLVRSRKFIIGAAIVLAIVLFGIIGPMLTRNPLKQFNKTFPSDATANFSQSSGVPSFDSTLTISTTENTPTGIYSVTVKGTGGGKVHSYTYTLAVTPVTAPDLGISISPSSGSVAPGESTTATVSLTSIAGLGEWLSEVVGLEVSGLPRGATYSFSQSSGVPSFDSTLTISTTENTPTGIYSITISGVGVRKSQSYIYTLIVAPVEVPDFDISVSPLSGSVAPGESTTATVSLTSIAGFSENVSLSVSGIRSIFINRTVEPPSSDFILGTTAVGEDVFAQLCTGIRNSLILGVIAGGLAALLAILVGGIGPYKGGLTDSISTALTNIVIVFPMLPLLIILSAILEEKSLLLVALLIGLTSWPWAARSIRSQVLTLKEREFINIARMSGMKDRKIVVTEIMPNMLAYIMMVFVISLSIAILTEAGMSMVGVGPNPDTIVTLGTMLHWVLNNALTAQAWNLWWWFIPPGLILTIFMGAVFVLHSGMDEVFNPRLRKV